MGPLSSLCGWGDRALQECNPSTQSSVECRVLHPFRTGALCSGPDAPLQSMVQSEKLKSNLVGRQAAILQTSLFEASHSYHAVFSDPDTNAKDQ